VLDGCGGRARRWRAIAPALRDASLQVEDAVFAADEESLLARLRTLPAETASVKLARYYPGLQDLGILLATGGDDLLWLREKFPTGALATLDADVDSWTELRPGMAALVRLVVPRALR
jgi:phosphohistidine phosphatase